MHTSLLQKNKKNNAGFTLIELLVVIGIIVVMTSIALANYKQFNSEATLANTAYNLALTIHQTQLYGIAVRENGTNTNQFKSAYGMHFSAPDSYIIYQDIPQADGSLTYFYNTSMPEELVTKSTLPPGFTISKICFLTTSDVSSEQCEDPSTTSDAILDIEFVRPNPDAYMTTNIPISATGGQLLPPNSPAGNYSAYYAAHIYLTSGTHTRSVFIDKTGEISVQ